jgi:hypothetical protein
LLVSLTRQTNEIPEKKEDLLPWEERVVGLID